MNLEAVVFFTVLIGLQIVVLRAYGKVVRHWRSILPAPLPADWHPFDGERQTRGRPVVSLGRGWLAPDLDPGADWSLSVVEGEGGDAALIVMRRVRFPPPAGPTYRAHNNPLAQLAEQFHGYREVPCTRTFAWAQTHAHRLRALKGEPDDAEQVLRELGVEPFWLLVALPADPIVT